MTEKIEWYKEVLELEPNSKVFFPLARLLAEEGYVEEAIKTLEDGLERHAEFLEARLFLIELLHGFGREDKCSAQVDKLSKMFASYAGFWQAWAACLSSEKEADTASILRFLAAQFVAGPLQLHDVLNRGLETFMAENKPKLANENIAAAKETLIEAAPPLAENADIVEPAMEAAMPDLPETPAAAEEPETVPAPAGIMAETPASEPLAAEKPFNLVQVEEEALVEAEVGSLPETLAEAAPVEDAKLADILDEAPVVAEEPSPEAEMDLPAMENIGQDIAEEADLARGSGPEAGHSEALEAIETEVVEMEAAPEPEPQAETPAAAKMTGKPGEDSILNVQSAINDLDLPEMMDESLAEEALPELDQQLEAELAPVAEEAAPEVEIAAKTAPVQPKAPDMEELVDDIMEEGGESEIADAALEADLAPQEEPFSLRTRSMAEVLAEQGDIQGALDIYHELAATASDTDESEDIKRRIATLSSRLGIQSEAHKPEERDNGSSSRDQLIGMLEALANRVEARAQG